MKGGINKSRKTGQQLQKSYQEAKVYCRKADEQNDLEKVQRIIYEVAVKEIEAMGQVTPSPYDAVAIHYLIFKDDEAVGLARIIPLKEVQKLPPESSIPLRHGRRTLPIEKLLSQTSYIPKVDKAVECSRLFILKEHRYSKLLLPYLNIGAVCMHCLKYGYTDILGQANVTGHNSFKNTLIKLGSSSLTDGPVKNPHYENIEVLPMLLKISNVPSKYLELFQSLEQSGVIQID